MTAKKVHRSIVTLRDRNVMIVEESKNNRLHIHNACIKLSKIVR